MTKRILMWPETELENSVYVGEGTFYSNPFLAYEHCPGEDWGVIDTGRFDNEMGHGWTKRGAQQAAVSLYKHAFDETFPEGSTVRKIIGMNLEGKDLGCQCPLDEPCHADYLFEIVDEWTTWRAEYEEKHGSE